MLRVSAMAWRPFRRLRAAGLALLWLLCPLPQGLFVIAPTSCGAHGVPRFPNRPCCPAPCAPGFACPVLQARSHVAAVIVPLARAVAEGSVRRLWFSLEETFVLQFSTAYPKYFPPPPASQALSPVICCPVLAEFGCGFIAFSIEVTQGKATRPKLAACSLPMVPQQKAP